MLCSGATVSLSDLTNGSRTTIGIVLAVKDPARSEQSSKRAGEEAVMERELTRSRPLK